MSLRVVCSPLASEVAGAVGVILVMETLGEVETAAHPAELGEAR
ncbi:hypothetical protein [Dactylosporangium cerinum]